MALAGYAIGANERFIYIHAKFAAAWALSDRAPGFGDEPGLTVTELIPLAGEHKVRALYILGEDPLLTDPDLNHVRRSLEQCEFTVLQEIFPSETSQLADVLLLGAAFA